MRHTSSGDLKYGRIVSCGCYAGVWLGMKKWCGNSNDPQYPHYGGREIRVCERWLESFENFYADMGPRPSPRHRIDRIDVNGNFEAATCEWATCEWATPRRG